MTEDPTSATGTGGVSRSAFGASFKAFMDAMLAQASPPESPLLNRIRAHLGHDPATLPVIAEEFDAFEHPNVQVAFDALLAEEGRSATLVGVAAENKPFMALSLSDLLGRSGRAFPAEGPVDYVNFHLADDRVLSCVQFGLYLIQDHERRLVAFVTGPSDRGGPRMRVRVEILALRPDDAQLFLAALIERMQALNVYRGHVISLLPGMLGMGPQTRCRGTVATTLCCRTASWSALSARPAGSQSRRNACEPLDVP